MTAKRLAAIAAITWSVLAVPAMCMGGVLEHKCAPEECPDCGHEDECGDDPCATVLIRTEDGPGAGDAVDLVGTIKCIDVDPYGSVRAVVRLHHSFHHRLSGLPFPVSDVPLLI